MMSKQDLIASNENGSNCPNRRTALAVPVDVFNLAVQAVGDVQSLPVVRS